jgi:hypothetical protein
MGFPKFHAHEALCYFGNGSPCFDWLDASPRCAGRSGSAVECTKLMTFRRKGDKEHADQREWHRWKDEHAATIEQTGLPAGVLQTRADWEYFLRYGYWCADYYGAHVGKIDFGEAELTTEQASAVRLLARSYKMGARW